jgi:leucyl aminopeptidase (aminopeptidase T)
LGIKLASFEEILATARMAVKICTNVKRCEEVLIATDSNKMGIADVLAKASREVGAETTISVMHPREMHGNEPPSVVAAAMKAANVILAPTTYSMTHTDAMVEATRAGARAIILRGITEEMMVKGAMTANYEDIRRNSIKLYERLKKGRRIHVASEEGTDLELSIEDRPVFVLAGFAREPGTFAALPDGEVPTSPVEGSAEGMIVFDHTMDGIGLLKDPIRLKVEGGKVTEIYGGEEAKKLRSIIKASDEGATNIAEFAIGTNPKALLIGNMAEDKKKEGSVHNAIGDNHKLGGTVKSSIHLDGLMVKPTVKLDGEVIARRGKLFI